MTKHAIDRAKERLNLDLTFADLREIKRQIERGDGVLQAKKAACAEIWLVKHKGQIIAVMFDRRKRRITTILPPNGKTHRPF